MDHKYIFFYHEEKMIFFVKESDKVTHHKETLFIATSIVRSSVKVILQKIH